MLTISLLHIYSMCVLGKRLMKDIAINNCSKEIGGPLHNLYCNVTTGICEDYYTSKCRFVYFSN